MQGVGGRAVESGFIAPIGFSKLVPFIFLWHLLFEKTWPILGVGDGQGCRGEGVGQGAGAGSIDSIDHQKPGPESCWRERGGNGVWCYLELELRLEEGNKDGRYWNEDGRCGIVMEKVS